MRLRSTFMLYFSDTEYFQTAKSYTVKVDVTDSVKPAYFYSVVYDFLSSNRQGWTSSSGVSAVALSRSIFRPYELTSVQMHSAPDSCRYATREICRPPASQTSIQQYTDSDLCRGTWQAAAAAALRARSRAVPVCRAPARDPHLRRRQRRGLQAGRPGRAGPGRSGHGTCVSVGAVMCRRAWAIAHGATDRCASVVGL